MWEKLKNLIIKSKIMEEEKKIFQSLVYLWITGKKLPFDLKRIIMKIL